MPTIYEVKFDGSNATRYFHISLVRLYLDQAYKYSVFAKEHKDDELASSITAIVFSAMALEAFVNEVSEDIIEDKKELNKFLRLKKPYEIKSGEGSIGAKYRILFELKFNYVIDNYYLEKIQTLIELRNNLVHYKLTELAGIATMPPAKSAVMEDGQIMSSINFMDKPIKFEIPFIHKINSRSAASSFNAALSVISKWGEMKGIENFIPGLHEII